MKRLMLITVGMLVVATGCTQGKVQKLVAEKGSKSEADPIAEVVIEKERSSAKCAKEDGAPVVEVSKGYALVGDSTKLDDAAELIAILLSDQCATEHRKPREEKAKQRRRVEAEAAEKKIPLEPADTLQARLCERLVQELPTRKDLRNIESEMNAGQFGCPPAPPVPPKDDFGEWEFSTREDEMTGEKTVFAQLSGEKGLLTLRWKGCKMEAFVNANERLTVSDYYGGARVEIRRDEGPLEKWSVSPSRDYQAFFLSSPESLFSGLVGVSKLRIRYPTYSSSAVTSFELGDLDRVLARGKRGCGTKQAEK